MTYRILCGDVREKLAEIESGSVQTCVTSPPYFGLRDYGHAGQIGLEATPEAFVAAMVSVFAEVGRVLKDDGTLWLNLGDSYAGYWGDKKALAEGRPSAADGHGFSMNARPKFQDAFGGSTVKAKDLIGIPWMVAFALRSAGWYLRADVIWNKPNPMPESVTDRPTKAHEYVFLLSKSARYYYDAAAIREAYAASTVKQFEAAYTGQATKDYKGTGAQNPSDVKRRITDKQRGHGRRYAGFNDRWDAMERTEQIANGANCRSVWTFATRPYPDAHFATFPEELPTRCILAGSRGPGKRCDCAESIDTPLGEGATDDPSLVTGRAGFNRPRRANEGTRPITRREQREYAKQMKASPHRDEMAMAAGSAFAHYVRTDKSGARPLPPSLLREWLSIGWLTPATPCDCPIEPGDLILDPFTGSGTTGAVALKLGRSFVGCELNPAYVELAQKRIGSASPLFAQEIA